MGPRDSWGWPLRDFPDRAIRRILESRGSVRGLMGIVAPDLVDRFDHGRIVFLPRTFIDEAHRERESDCICHLPYRPRDGSSEREVWVYILIEHQSAPDRWVPFRLLLSIARLWEGERREQEECKVPEGERGLSPVLPIVLYTGEREWASPGSLAELTGAPEELTGFQPLFDSVFFGVRQGSLEALTRGKDPLGWLLRLFRLERASAEEFAKAVQEAFERMESLVAAGETERWLRMAWFVVGFIRYRRPAEEAEELLSAARRVVGDPTRGQEVVAMGKTSAEVLEEKGEAKGELRGKRETLLRQMRLKFGALPEDVERRIEALTEVSRIDELLDRILTAATIQEMGT